MSRFFRGLRARYNAFSLSVRFALIGSAVMCGAAIIAGYWLTSVISQGVVSNTAGATALFMDSYIGPLAQELDTTDTLSIGPIRAIEELLDGSEFGKRVVSIKIWKPDGLIAYGEDDTMIGRRFPVSESLRKAFAGGIVAELDELDDEESANEKASGLPLLEIYSPIREAWTGHIIAVAEFYEDATDLQATLRRAMVQTWLLVATMMLMIGAALFGIVHRASTVIERQREALRIRMSEAMRAAEQNRQLRLRVERAAGRASELNERFLRRVGADLHDGPAQLISLAALRLLGLANGSTKAARLSEMTVVKSALDEAMREIRDICGGLSLPDIENKPLAAIIRDLAQAHERLTTTPVALDFGPLPEKPSAALKICVFRFVQEGLSNAFRHAGGVDQRVEAVASGETLTMRVRNGPASGQAASESGGLGLAGLRERIESLGGAFTFEAPEGGEAVMTLAIDVTAGANDA
ncbi:sensor histidine kinase [Mesorhizobium yinganensis]|uniref:sensor histidine kinase n=1 Tax=Mesorhizobium yinganensis TaxID=3157707 RepID=UPI0032B75D9F